MLGFTAALSIAAGALFGMFPALQALRPGLVDLLRHGGATSGATSGRRGPLGVSTRGTLVIGQVALSTVLLVGAALMIKSLSQVAGVDPGFRPEGLLTMRIPLPAARYDSPAKRASFFEELVRRVETLPGSSGAAVARSLPATRNLLGTNLQIQSQPIAEPGHLGIGLQTITPSYFRVLGVPRKRGRSFTERDSVPGARPVVIVNESFARRFWPAYTTGPGPLGQALIVPILRGANPLEIVGVVGNVHERGPTQAADPQIYIPTALYPPQIGYLSVRTERDPTLFINAIRAEVQAVDPDQAVTDIRMMDEVFEASVGQQHLVAWLLGLFAGAALLLALVGIYGVLAYSVAQRTQEIGIRCALGARPGDILKNVLGHGFALTLIGVVVGIGGALALTRVMTGILFRVSPTDPLTFVGIAALFIVVALVASYIPGRRAAAVDPARVLR